MRMVQSESKNARDMGQGVKPSSGTDYIRTYLGLMGSGKTTQAFRDIERSPRVIVYSPGTTNPLMLTLPYVHDTSNYLKDFSRWIKLHPRIRFEKKAFPSMMFRVLSQVKGYSILLDDVAALKTNGQERADFEAFIRTIRFNGNHLVMTTHRARKDLPPLVNVLGTSFYYVGPGPRYRKEIEALYELVNYPISEEEFIRGLEANPARNGTKSAGIFKIRGA